MKSAELSNLEKCIIKVNIKKWADYKMANKYSNDSKAKFFVKNLFNKMKFITPKKMCR